MFEDTIETVGKATDAVGVAIIVLGALWAAVLAGRDIRRMSSHDTYRSVRQRVGRAILLGLEVLVAADIIRTVAVSPTVESAAVLGIIVLIRTVLSISLEVELEGEWPWRARASSGDAPARTR